MTLLPQPPYVLVDTEYTTWQGAHARRWSGPGELREVIQIGALLIGADHREVGRFIRFVRPVFNPVLSDYCIGLTGITQDIIETQGVPFGQAQSEFASFAGGMDIWCYGSDGIVMQENCRLHAVEYPFRQFKDVRDIVRAAGHDPLEWTSGTIHKLAGQPRPGGREHDACDDCLSIASFISAVYDRGIHDARPAVAFKPYHAIAF